MPDEKRNLMVAGLDIGKTQDHSVLSVIERLEGDPPKGDLVYLETWKLGTSYPDFTDRLRYLFDQPPLRRSIPIVIDARGPGAPVVDELQKAGFAVVPVLLHGGARTSRVVTLSAPGIAAPPAGSRAEAGALARALLSRLRLVWLRGRGALRCRGTLRRVL